MYNFKFRTGLLLFSFALLSFTALYGQSEAEKNKALMNQFYNGVVNQGKLELIDQLFADNFVEHESIPDQAAGKEGVKNFFAMYRQAFPDLKFTVNDQVADGDKVWSYVTITGTNSGPFMGMPATDKQITIHGCDIVRFANGKAVEHWGITDAMSMMTQLGKMPPHEMGMMPQH